jgi:hypothetical protein
VLAAARAAGINLRLQGEGRIGIALDTPIDEAQKKEREYFFKLVGGDQSKAQRHIFFAEREAAKVPGIGKDVQTREINKAGVSVVMVEQNAARCLQICDRGYVLDHGRNAYTATGQQLAKDPKVIELYLGTLAKKVL